MLDDLVSPALKDTKAALDGASPTYCLAKWLQATLHLHNGNTQSCHHVKSHEIDLRESERNPAALHNTAAKLEARQTMMDGQRPSECSYCWKVEDHGRLSDRLVKSSSGWALPHFSETLASGVGPTIRPRYLEISFDSVCNFRCMYCSPAYSSSWLEEIRRFGAYPTSGRFNDLNRLAKQGVLPVAPERRDRYVAAFWRWWPELVGSLEHFRITGGEPFLAKETFDVFEWLAAHPRPALNFAVNTNLSLSPEKLARVIARINALRGHVRQFTIFTSVDCVGARAEYIRHGLDFKRFCTNGEALLAEVQTPFCFSYMITVNALSVTGLGDLLALILDQRRRYPLHQVTFDTPFLKNPEMMSVEILTPDFVRHIDAAVAFMRANLKTARRGGFEETEIVKVDRIRDLMLRPDAGGIKRFILRRDFYKMFTEYDRRRGTDFQKTFPEYAEFWRHCGKWAVL